MGKPHKNSDFERDIEMYIERGEECVLWGVPVALMTRDELIGFIGFLDMTLETVMVGVPDVKH